MENSSADSMINLFVWGVVLLGTICFFVRWGLVNAYPSYL